MEGKGPGQLGRDAVYVFSWEETREGAGREGGGRKGGRMTSMVVIGVATGCPVLVGQTLQLV